jgi:hypothetical protein
MIEETGAKKLPKTRNIKNIVNAQAGGAGKRVLRKISKTRKKKMSGSSDKVFSHSEIPTPLKKNKPINFDDLRNWSNIQ